MTHGAAEGGEVPGQRSAELGKDSVCSTPSPSVSLGKRGHLGDTRGDAQAPGPRGCSVQHGLREVLTPGASAQTSPWQSHDF